MTTAQLPTSEVLYLAADLIEKRGWVAGTQGWPDTRLEDSKLCLEGGIMAALGFFFNDLEFKVKEFWECPAYRAVEAYLDHPRDADGHGRLWRFNDRSDRGVIIEVLRSAAVIEEARESELAEVSA